MNKENLIKMRDFLKKLPEEKFNMSDWVEHKDCGTVACIAGWGEILFDKEKEIEAAKAKYIEEKPQWRYDAPMVAYTSVIGEGVFGLSKVDARDLFVPAYTERRTKDEAVEVLTDLIETEEVYWEPLEEDDDD